MAYDLKLEAKPGYLRVVISGTRQAGQEVSAGQDAWRQLGAYCLPRQITRVLIVSQLEGPLPTLAAFQLGSSGETFGWDRSIHVAFVDRNLASQDSNLFAETVAVNRGYRLKVFSEETEATTWLLAPQPSPLK